jgi:alkaline phosphatase D
MSGAGQETASARMVAVGAVSERRARLWLRADAPGPFTVELLPRGGERRVAEIAHHCSPGDDGTMAFTVPDDAPALGPLATATEYRFRISLSHTDELVGEGRFETAPPEETRAPFAFAFMSCHQPFRPDGSIHPESARMMAALEPALEARGVKYLLLVGDQIYADAPQSRRLLRADSVRPLVKMSLEEIRARYQSRYRLFWAPPEMRRLQARWPTWCIWDDHEIVDDWGARRAHTKPDWRRVFEGARRAFVDYQASRTAAFGPSLPSAFNQSFVWGRTATFIMDLISQRIFVGRQAQVYGDDQLDALKQFLHEQVDRPVVFVVLTVPPVYLPDWLVAIGERVPSMGASFAARWNAARNRRALDRLFDVLRAHQRVAPEQKLVLLSGDVHQGAALGLRWPTGERAYQFVSSPVTHVDNNWKGIIARRLSFSMRGVLHGAERLAVEQLACTGPAQRNPFNGLNVGVVHVGEEKEGAAIRFELLTPDENRPEIARSSYDSGWL